jgi:hypothetical protein
MTELGRVAPMAHSGGEFGWGLSNFLRKVADKLAGLGELTSNAMVVLDVWHGSQLSKHGRVAKMWPEGDWPSSFWNNLEKCRSLRPTPET